MSELRITGLIMSFFVIIISLYFYKRRKFRGIDLVVGLSSGVAILIVSISPVILNYFTRQLSLTYSDSGRLLTLIVFSIAGLFLLWIGLNVRITKQEQISSKIIEDIALESYLKDHLEQTVNSIIIVIPAHNEQDNIAKVLNLMPDSINNVPVKVLVVDDGSTDETMLVAQKHGADVIRGIVNQGQGGALRLGYAVIKRFYRNNEVIVTMDADGQHDPGQIETIVAPILDGRADFVNGSRHLGHTKDVGVVRNAGVFLFSRLMGMLLFRKITDCSNGFRAFSMKLLDSLNLRETQYQSIEPIMQTIRKKFRYMEVPITVSARQSGDSKKPHNILYGYNYLIVIIKTWLRH